MQPLLQCVEIGEQDWDQLVITQALTTLVPEHLEEVKGERLERIAKAGQEIQSRMQRQINLWYRRYEQRGGRPIDEQCHAVPRIRLLEA